MWYPELYFGASLMFDKLLHVKLISGGFKMLMLLKFVNVAETFLTILK
jgi:hypothetical protein